MEEWEGEEGRGGEGGREGGREIALVGIKKTNLTSQVFLQTPQARWHA